MENRKITHQKEKINQQNIVLCNKLVQYRIITDKDICLAMTGAKE
jgi:hypothetical protein